MAMGCNRLSLKRSKKDLVPFCHFSTSILCLAVGLTLINSAVGLSRVRCNLDDCIDPYKLAYRRLKEAETTSSFHSDHTRKLCRVLKRLHNCLQKMQRACRGDLNYHSIKHMNDEKVKSTNCSCSSKQSRPLKTLNLSSVSNPKMLVPKTTPKATPTQVTKPKGDSCTFIGKPDYRHCGLFGDPHLRTFSDEFFTCKIEKTWPLIENDYMVVMVTNVPVKEGSSATVTTKITVLIKPHGECAGKQHYIATSEHLPRAFTDGSSVTGSVFIEEVSPGRLIKIHVRFIATTIIIRQVGQYLTFAIRMPLEIVNKHDSRTQLCVRGCPTQHRISSTQHMEALEINKYSTELLQTSHDYERTSNEANSLMSSKVLENRMLPRFPLASTSRREYFTERAARIKCKEIFLEAYKTKQSNTKEMEDLVKPTESPNQYPPSKTSKSALFKERGFAKRGRRKHKMAAAHKAVSQMSQSSFNQLSGSEEAEVNASVPLKSFNHFKKHRRNRRKKRKRHIGTPDDSTNRKATQPPRLELKTDKDFSPFNFYFDSCVFDLITTGDVNFSLIARAALQDVQQTHLLRDLAPGSSMDVISQWEPGTVESLSGNGSSKSSAFTWTLVLCIIALNYLCTSSILWASPFIINTSSNKRLFQSDMITMQYHERTQSLNNDDTVS